MLQKTILMILNQKFLPDTRVEQEADALIDAGYKVIIVASTEGVHTDKYDIIRIDVNKGLSRYYNLFLSSNPIMKKKIIDELEKRNVQSINAVHVHDLHWAFIGKELKEYYNAKLVIDFHEPWVEYSKAKKAINKKVKVSFKHYLKVALLTIVKPHNDFFYEILKNHFQSISKYIQYEKEVIAYSDGYIVVVEEAFKKFDKKYQNKGIVVMNSKDPKTWYLKKLPEFNCILEVTYMGTIQDLRGIDTVIESMKYLDQSKFKINIVGIVEGGELHKKFLNIIEKNKITNVNLVPFLKDEQKAFKYIENAHLCIVPHKNTKLTQEALPHKMFMYMSTGRPVIVSDCAPLKRIVTFAKNGYIFQAENPKDLAEKLKLAYNETPLFNELAKNGRKAVDEKYNWNFDKSRLLKMYNELI